MCSGYFEKLSPKTYLERMHVDPIIVLVDA